MPYVPDKHDYFSRRIFHPVFKRFKPGGRLLRDQSSYLQIENYHLGPATSRNFEPVKTEKFYRGLSKEGIFSRETGFSTTVAKPVRAEAFR